MKSFTGIATAMLLAALPLCGFAAAQDTFKAGAAFRVITPDPLLPVSGGVGKPNPATIKKGELTTRALVFEKGGTRVAIVSVDNLGWPAVLGDKTRAKVQGIPPENILIGATHTHSAPDAYGFPDMSGQHGADLDYLNRVCDLMAEAINEAVDSLRPAVLKIAVDRAKSKIAYNYYAPQLYDPRCGVIQAVAADGDDKGKAIATLVNYATHPEVIGNDQGILSPDLCGPLYDRIAEKTGGMGIFMNGAQGGMVTADCRDDNGGKDIQTWEECVRIGTLMADEALRIVADAPVQENPGLYCAARPVSFPMDSPLLKAVISMSPLGYNLPGDEFTTRVNLVNIGTAQVLTIPGEALPNIGYYLKRHMPARNAFLFGLTNDAIGYMLTSVDWMSFDRYEYISETSLGEKTGDLYIEAALKFIGESPKP